MCPSVRLGLVLAALCLPAFAAVAQIQTENIIGITEGDSSWIQNHCLYMDEGTVTTLYIYLEDPVNTAYDNDQIQPVTQIYGFECKLTATGDATILERRFPVPAIDVGQGDNIIVGFGEPVNVTAAGFAFLAEIDVMLLPGGDKARKAGDKASPLPCQDATGFLWLDPAYPASIEGHMVYLDWNDPDENPMCEAYGRYEEYGDPAFLIEPIVVASESRSFGSIKAIYR